jgi:uncharacterized membrane protein
MSLLIVGLVIFLGMHSISIISPGLRGQVLARLGPGGYRVSYSLVSLLGFALLVYGFGVARASPVVLWTPPLWMRHVTLLLMLPVFPMLLAAYLPGRIQRTLKHPMLTAVKLWALAHLLANGTLADVLLFGGFLVWAGLDRASLKRRPPKEIRMAPARPFNDVIAVVVGLALYVLFVTRLHLWLIGVAPLA